MPPILPQTQAAGSNSAPSPVAANDGTQLNPLAVNIAKAIRTTESGNDYSAVGDSGNSHGAYQFNGDNFKAFATQYGLNPDDDSPVNQDKVAYARINSLLQQGRSPSEVAAIWNGAKLVNGQYQAINPSYVTKVKDNYAKIVGGGLQQAPTGNLTSMNIPPPAQPGQSTQASGNAAGYAPPTPPPAPVQSAQPAANSSPGFLQGLQEDLTGTNPQGIGTQLANTVKGVGNALFPIVGDVGNDLSGKNQKSALQQAGDLGLSALPFIPGIGEAGEVLRGGDLAAEGAVDAAKTGLLQKVLGSTVGKGVLSGYGAGTLSNLSNGQGLIQSLTPNSTNVTSALTGGVAGAVLPKIAGVLSKTGESGDLQRIIQDGMPLENKATRMDAIDSGKVVRKGVLGTSSIVPDAEDIERGKAAAPYIGNEKDPVVQVQNLNAGIKDMSDKTDSFLDANAAPANFADMRDYMETNKPTSSLKNDPGAEETYTRVTNDALDTLYATMKKTANATGDFGPNVSGSSVREARIAIDQQIQKELGETTFGTPQYRGVKAAAIDSRNLLNRMSEDMLRYPGQMEKLNKYNDLIRGAQKRNPDIKVAPEEAENLKKVFGLQSTPESEANAQKLADAHKQMSHLYDYKQNVRDKYQNKIGKNKVQELVSRNPIAKTVVGLASRAIPFGLADHLTK